MQEIGAYEVKTKLAEYLRRVEQGESFTITRHGKAIATLGPQSGAHAHPRREKAQKAIEEWIAYRKKHNITLGDDITIKDLINEGRRFQ